MMRSSTSRLCADDPAREVHREASRRPASGRDRTLRPLPGLLAMEAARLIKSKNPHVVTKRPARINRAAELSTVLDQALAPRSLHLSKILWRLRHIGLMGATSWNAKLWGGGNGQARDPIPYELETDWPVGAAGFEPLHIGIGIAKTLSPGGGTRTCASRIKGVPDRCLKPVEAG
jgi:hypothetical protein